MVRAGSGIGVGIDPEAAVEEAAKAALAALHGSLPSDSRSDPDARRASEMALDAPPAPPSAYLLFATAAWGQALPRVLEAAATRLTDAPFVGASVFGVLHGGQELEQNPVVAILALSGVATVPLLLEGLCGDEERAGEEIADLLGGDPRAEDVVLLFPDSHSISSTRLVAGLRTELGQARVLGVGATELVGGSPSVWRGTRAVCRGASGLVLRLEAVPRVGIAQGANLITPAMRVTRAQGNWILGLEGRSAVDVYREAARGPLAEDLHRAARHVVVAITSPAKSCSEQDSGHLKVDLGSARLCQVAGFDTRRGGLSLPEPVAVGDIVSLAHVDARAARENLSSLLDGFGSEPPAFGLYFGCRTRGEALFGMSGLEAGYLQRIAAPLLGVTGPYQIGPIGPTSATARPPAVLTHAGALLLADDASGSV